MYDFSRLPHQILPEGPQNPVQLENLLTQALDALKQLDACTTLDSTIKEMETAAQLLQELCDALAFSAPVDTDGDMADAWLTNLRAIALHTPVQV